MIGKHKQKHAWLADYSKKQNEENFYIFFFGGGGYFFWRKID